jgi:hypothetical protein
VSQLVTKLSDITDQTTTTKCCEVLVDGLGNILVDTAHGIKQYHKFTFHRDYTVCGYIHSATEEATTSWKLVVRDGSGTVI